MQITTLEQVASWLRENSCPMTSMELFFEWRNTHHESYQPLLDVARQTHHTSAVLAEREGMTTSTVDTNAWMEQAVVDLLLEYGNQKGLEAMIRAVRRAIMQMPKTGNGQEGSSLYTSAGLGTTTSNAVPISNDDSTVVNKMIGDCTPLNEERGEATAVVERKLHQVERELSTSTSILSESLPKLIPVVDPMQKDTLIPLIHLSATLNNSTSGRAASRLLLLTLYTRPNHEHRVTVAEAWARAIKHTFSSLSEGEMVLELFNLANAKSVERRLLALNCLYSVAPHLTDNPSQRRSICQGLLFPLSQDESKTVRCQVVQCLVELWPKISDDLIGTDREQQSSDDEGNLCLSCFVELLLRLALHDPSTTVQGRAFQSLRSQLLSGHVPRRVLLTRVVTLLLSFLERESYVAGNTESSIQPLAVVGKRRSATTTTSTTTTPAAAAAVAASIAAKKSDAVVTTSIKNALLLAGLIGDILRYTREDYTSSGDGVNPSVFEAYLRVVLPSACALVLTGPDREATDASICAVASALSVMIPALRMFQWKHIRTLLGLTLSEALHVHTGSSDDLTTTIPTATGISAGGYTGSTNTSVLTKFLASTPVGVSMSGRTDVLCRAGWRQRQMCFLFAFLTCVAGRKDATGNVVSIDSSDIAADAAVLLRETLMMAKEEWDKVLQEGRQERKGKEMRIGEREGIRVVEQERYHEHEKHQHQQQEQKLHHEMMMESKGTDTCAPLDACATSLACLASYVDDTHGSAAAVSSLLSSLAESPSENQRLLAVVLVSRVSGLPKDDHVREAYIWPPLLSLMNDGVYAVQEAAVMAAVSMVTVISTAATQEEVLRTALAAVEASGCPSPLSVALLRHWCSLMRVMPAEPQENLMYPLLARMMGHLKDALCKSRTTTPPSAASSLSSSPKGVHVYTTDGKVVDDTLQAVLDVLAAIPHSAVVTPQLVNKYLIPGIQLLASVPTLTTSNRSRLVNTLKEYNAVMGSGKVLQGTTTFLARIREEIKKHF